MKHKSNRQICNNWISNALINIAENVKSKADAFRLDEKWEGMKHWKKRAGLSTFQFVNGHFTEGLVIIKMILKTTSKRCFCIVLGIHRNVTRPLNHLRIWFYIALNPNLNLFAATLIDLMGTVKWVSSSLQQPHKRPFSVIVSLPPKGLETQWQRRTI